MGMYTELFLQVELKKDTPDEIINTLAFMVGQDSKEPKEQPFKADRWDTMLRCSSHYHFPLSHSSLDYLSYIGSFYLFVRCDFKDYSGELRGFLNWLSPYVEHDPTHYEGHWFYEEDDEPTRIRFKGDSYDF